MKRIMGKWLLILPAVGALVLVGGILLMSSMVGRNAASQIKMGQKYLEDLDYNQAIVEFSRAVQVDPGNTDAQIGLAKSYLGSGERGVGLQVLHSYARNTTDPDALGQMADLFSQSGDADSANWLLNVLINETDEDAYYDAREDLREALPQRSDVSLSSTHALVMGTQGVTGTGSNRYGQLASSQGQGDPDFLVENGKVSVPGTARKVYAGNHTSFVIDDGGKLWAAGLNLTGQLGIGSTTMPYVDTFEPVPGLTGVVSVASGGTHTLFLTGDGTVYGTGNNGSGQLGSLPGTVHTPAPIPGLHSIVKIEAAGDYSLALGVDGSLYLMGMGPGRGVPAGFPVLVGENIMKIAAAGDYYVTLSYAGEIRVLGASLPGEIPDDAVGVDASGFRPRVTPTDLAATDGMLVWQDYNGSLNTLSSQGHMKWEGVWAVSMDAGSGAVILIDDAGGVSMLSRSDSGLPVLAPVA